jgi:hypothetical protein
MKIIVNVAVISLSGNSHGRLKNVLRTSHDRNYNRGALREPNVIKKFPVNYGFSYQAKVFVFGEFFLPSLTNTLA